jgi:hypothetical protein
MLEVFKKAVMGVLIWLCIIWACAFDPKQVFNWFTIACWLGGFTWFWWWICGFESPFRESDEVA